MRKAGYRERGRSLRERARFTYLYAAARVKGAWRAWLGARPVLDRGEPVVSTSRLLGHGISSREVYGAREALTGWDRTVADPLISIAAPRWAPGSRTREEVAWKIDPEGSWLDSP